MGIHCSAIRNGKLGRVIQHRQWSHIPAWLLASATLVFSEVGEPLVVAELCHIRVIFEICTGNRATDDFAVHIELTTSLGYHH